MADSSGPTVAPTIGTPSNATPTQGTPVTQSLYKSNVDGVTHYQVLPDFNISPTSGLTKASTQEATDYLNQLKSMGNYTPGSQTGPQFDPTPVIQETQNALNQLNTNPNSGYVRGPNGELTTQQSLNEQATNPGLLIPPNSPAALLKTNPAAYAAKYGGQGVPGQSSQGTYQSNVNSNDYAKGAEAATAAGASASTPSDAKTLLDTYLNNGSNAATSFVSSDPYLQQIKDTLNHYLSNQNQETSLLDTYNDLAQQAGLPKMKADAINMDNVINGTLDDIKTEITKAGGFATNSQVIALANARNKQLINNYNALEKTITNTESYINNQVSLTEKDQANANTQFKDIISVETTMADMEQKAQAYNVTTIGNVAKAIGWDGLYAAAQSDPAMVAEIEKTYGLPSGGLAIAAQEAINAKNLTTQKETLANEQSTLNLTKTEAEINNLNNPAVWSSPKFNPATGEEYQVNSKTGEIKNIGKEGDGGATKEQNAFKTSLKTQIGDLNTSKTGGGAKTSWGDAYNTMAQEYAGYTYKLPNGKTVGITDQLTPQEIISLGGNPNGTNYKSAQPGSLTNWFGSSESGIPGDQTVLDILLNKQQNYSK